MRRKTKKNDPSRKKTVKAALPAGRRRPARPVRKPIRKKALKKPRTAARKTVPSAVAAVAVQPITWEDKRLPAHYGDDRLVLLVRDPWWLFTYWEVTPQKQQEVLAQIGPKNHSERKTVLRVYDVTGGLALPRSNSFFDIELNFYTENWYIDVGMPDREWVIELGYRVEGRFYSLLRSNRVQTPAFGISDVLDEEWMLPEDVYYRLLGRSIGAESAGDSMDIRKLLEKYLRNVVSSERLPESSKKVQHLAAQ